MISRRQAFAALASVLPAGSVTAEDAEKAEVGDLVKLLADAVQHLRQTSPPIGSVQAFAGVWTLRNELEMGWLLCDGRNLTDLQNRLHNQLNSRGKAWPEEGLLYNLRLVLPRISDDEPAQTLPDYRGYFLRGYDPTGKQDKTDPVENDKTGQRRKVRTLGSEQFCTTALPKEKNFKTGNQSDNPTFARLIYRHSFVFQVDNKQSADHFDGWEKPKTEGSHTHEVVGGGDLETRPINIAVNYIIKFQ